MEDRGSGIEREVLINLTDYLASLLAECGYQVVPRDQIRERLTIEQKETYKACFDQACQIELGRELAAQKVLATQVLRIGKTCQVTSNLYDLKKTATELAANASASCDVDSLLSAVRTVASKLCGQLAGKTKKETRRVEDEQAAEREAAGKAAEQAAARAREAKARSKAEAKRKAAERRKKARVEAELRRIQEKEKEYKRKVKNRRKARIRPLMLEDMRGVMKVDFPFAYLPGEDYDGIGLLLSVEAGEEDPTGGMFGMGAELPISLHSPDEGESGDHPGSILASVKYLMCLGSDWSFCLGTSTAISLGVIEEIEDSEEPDEKRIAQLASQRVGRAAFQDPSRFMVDQFAFRPLGVMTFSGHDFFSQVQVGGVLYAPIQNMEEWEAVGFSLMYGLAAGYQVVDWFIPMVEFNGNSPLAGKPVPVGRPGEGTSLFFNFGFVLDLDDGCGMVRLTVPLTDDAKLGTDVHLGLALSMNI